MWRYRLELQKSMDARKMFGSSEANGNTGACGVRSVNGPANVAPNARPMCLWPAETEQFAQPVESATAVGKMRASHARGRIVKHAHAIKTLPFSNGQKLGFVIQGVCLRRDVALRCTVGESHQRVGLTMRRHRHPPAARNLPVRSLTPPAMVRAGSWRGAGRSSADCRSCARPRRHP